MEIKINKEASNLEEFNNLLPGSLFQYENDDRAFYIKTDDDKGVNLSTGAVVSPAFDSYFVDVTELYVLTDAK